nr:helix-turn-helix domain-containing protein [Streptomyces sp. XY413]
MDELPLDLGHRGEHHEEDLARALRVVGARERPGADLKAVVAFGEVLRAGDELDHVAAEPVEHGDGERVGRAQVGEGGVVLGADLLSGADLLDVDTDALGFLQRADLPGEVLALAGDPGVADMVAGPRERGADGESGSGPGSQARPGPRAAGMRIAGSGLGLKRGDLRVAAGVVVDGDDAGVRPAHRAGRRPAAWARFALDELGAGDLVQVAVHVFPSRPAARKRPVPNTHPASPSRPLVSGRLSGRLPRSAHRLGCPSRKRDDMLAVALRRRDAKESVTAIARRLGIGRSTLYRTFAAYDEAIATGREPAG